MNSTNQYTLTEYNIKSVSIDVSATPFIFLGMVLITSVPATANGSYKATDVAKMSVKPNLRFNLCLFEELKKPFYQVCVLGRSQEVLQGLRSMIV